MSRFFRIDQNLPITESASFNRKVFNSLPLDGGGSECRDSLFGGCGQSRRIISPDTTVGGLEALVRAWRTGP
jgi:hypothetical protein